jgi:hypothetical protein
LLFSTLKGAWFGVIVPGARLRRRLLWLMMIRMFVVMTVMKVMVRGVMESEMT